MTEHIKEKIAQLRSAIRYHNMRYYVQDSPEISDKEWDNLFAELISLEKQYPEYIAKDSPTQRLEVGVREEFSQAEHYSRLLSLSNTYNPQDLRDFDERVKKILGRPMEEQIDYAVELKYDGLSLALVYEDGRLLRATTRGNGIVGEDVTENIYTIQTVPTGISDYTGVVEFRGEVLMDKKAFEDLNESRAEKGESLFANPRNAASGSLRLLDSKETAKRRLSFFAYDITYGGPALRTHIEELLFMKEQGLPTGEYVSCKGIEEVITLIPLYEEKRFSLPFEIDGLVVKVDDSDAKEKLGATEHHPRSQIAYKFPAIEEITTVEQIEIQVGRTGVLTPVAYLTPVQIGGVTVARASLHNSDEIEKKDIRVGDKVIIKRAGDVIPYVVKSLHEQRTGSEVKFVMPPTCPVCHGDVVSVPDEVAYRCININCSAQVVERLKYFVSKQAMDIDGFGGKSVEAFVEAGILSKIEDIYTLHEKKEALINVLYAEGSQLVEVSQGDLFQSEHTGSLKLLERIISAIERSKKQPLYRVLTGFGIRFVGTKTSKLISGRVGDIFELFEFTRDDFLAIDGIGPVVAESLVDFFAEERNREMIQHLRERGLSLRNTQSSQQGEGALKGKSFVFTGTLQEMTREDATVLTESHGGKVLSSVSKNLDYLVVGEKAGSKLRKAKEMGIPILSEKEFISLVK